MGVTTQALLDAKADPNKASRNRVTALGLAAEVGNVKSVELLLLGNADGVKASVDMGNGDGKDSTPLIDAASLGHLKVVQELLLAGVRHPLACSRLRGRSNGANPCCCFAQANRNKGNTDGKTALIAATENGHEDVVKLLLNLGSHLLKKLKQMEAKDVNQLTTKGLNALNFARGNKPIIELLKKAGAVEHTAS